MLLDAIDARTATVGVCGLGYVGLPLAMAAGAGGYRVVGFDVDADKVARLAAGDSYLGTVHSRAIADATSSGRFTATCNFSELSACDVIIICVPTPLTRHREPDLSYVRATADSIAACLRPGQLIVLESTTYPGTTEEVLKPILEGRTGLRSGQDFFLGFSPEREDPGNLSHGTTTIPKVVSGDGSTALELLSTFYKNVVSAVVPVSSTATAEAVKITENVFRSVNIALVNELKLVYDAMGVDVWEVIEAAKTKPFGYMPFYPGPGLGGHCIPIDPFYLTWKAREHGISTRFIELAGEINTAMPRHVLEKTEEGLDRYRGVALGSARILLLGLAYKKNVSDIRESPALKLIELFEKRGARTSYHDPHVPEIPATREYGALAGRRSHPFTPDSIRSHDVIVVVTDHDSVGYGLLANADLVVDTRNVCARRGVMPRRIIKA